MIEAPSRLTVPTLYEGNTAEISWSDVDGATGYELERSVDKSDYGLVADGEGTNYIDFIPDGVESVSYRVQSYIDNDRTWDELDEIDFTFDEFDEWDLPWTYEESDWTTSPEYEVIPNRPPIISGQDADLGIRYNSFTIEYSVTDPDPNSVVSVVVTLNNSQIYSNANIQLGVVQYLTLTDEQIFALPDGATNTILITATDNKGATDQRTYAFISVEDVLSTATYYLLRDGVPIARGQDFREFHDYAAVGTHTYVIRGIDKYKVAVDSNPVTITTDVAGSALAPATDPAQIITLNVRRNSPVSRSWRSDSRKERVYFEGRSAPVIVGFELHEESFDIEFSHLTLDQRNEFRNLRGQTLIYRDLYGERAFCEIMSIDENPYGKDIGVFEAVIDMSVQFAPTEYIEQVEYD